jgi:hypothetical protein
MVEYSKAMKNTAMVMKGEFSIIKIVSRVYD